MRVIGRQEFPTKKFFICKKQSKLSEVSRGKKDSRAGTRRPQEPDTGKTDGKSPD